MTNLMAISLVSWGLERGRELSTFCLKFESPKTLLGSPLIKFGEL